MSDNGLGYKIATIGSHSALQILKGAKDEGFETLAIVKAGRAKPYESYKVADEIIELNEYSDFAKLEKKLIEEKTILIPHGSFFNVFDLDTIFKSEVMYYGNKHILPWEENRNKQRDWLKTAKLQLPLIFKDPSDIDRPVIIKFFGAGGGKGFFLAHSPDEFRRKIKENRTKAYIIQEYIIGAPIYIHYFYSPIEDELEIMSIDKRYESNVDSLGRIAAKDQLDLNIESSYNITGNMPLVIRESLLPEAFAMGQRVVDASKMIEPNGLIGPFCLETIVTPELDFYTFEISARIVAGTNPYIKGSPYTDLRYDVPMSTGRRVALEIKNAIKNNELEKVLVNDYK